MTKTSYQTRRLSLIFLFLLIFLLTLFFSLPWVSANEETKPNPQDWEKKGIVAALADPYAQTRLEAANKLTNYKLDYPSSQIPNYKSVVKQLVNQLSLSEKDNNEKLISRYAAVEALGQLQAKDQAANVASLLKDPDSGVRSAAVYALGQLQAKDQVANVVSLLKDSDYNVRYAAVYALGQLQAKDQVANIASLLEDSDSRVRSAAVDALGQLQAKDQVANIASLLKDSDSGLCFSESLATGNNVCTEVVKVLPQLGKQDFPQGLPVLVQVLNAVHKYPSEVSQFRFLAHFIGAGDQGVETLMQWVGKPKVTPKSLPLEDGRKIMVLFKQAWEESASLPDLQQELAQKIAYVADLVNWQSQDINLLQSHYKNLESGDYQADSYTVQRVIILLEFQKWLFLAISFILVHLVLWLALILAYPKFPQIQATFFWNPLVRELLGFGYISLLLTRVPYLRRRLLEPFKPTLLADARLEDFIDQAYFPNSNVKVPTITLSPTPPRWWWRAARHQPKLRSYTQPIIQALPTLQGQIVLEGDSGLGKSMFLRYLVKNSQRIVIYLPAQQCDKGVIQAIYAKFPKHARDAKFLKSLVYSKAMDICIDGLNEVTADTRAKISEFAESFSQGNMIMTTQPLGWIPPSTAKKYELQPLQPEQIQDFLKSRLPKDATLKDAEYKKKCSCYIAKAFNEQQSPEDLAAAKQILSNPMDLTLVALMLSQGKEPNIFCLQEEQYQLMAEEYRRKWIQEFPLNKFSQAVYQMRLEDKNTIPSDEFFKELSIMEDEKYKMVVSRQWENDKGKSHKNWYFRHDKIMEFFLVQNFCGESEEVQNRITQHIKDPRFRGVYLLLANLLPLETVLELRERLIEYAANTKDHTLSDKFVQLSSLRWPQWTQDSKIKQLLQQHQQKANYLDLVTKFLKHVGAKIKREKEPYITVETIEGSLSIYSPFPVLVRVDNPTDKDVIQIQQISAQLAREHMQKTGLLLYKVPPDTTAKMEIAKVRLRDNFLLIPISLALVEKSLTNKSTSVGLLEEYVDRYLQRADFFDDKNAISDTLSFFGRTELLQRLGEELLRYQGIGLFGLRKSGKTSVLLQLGFMLREHPVVHIDLQKYGGSRYGAALFNDIIQYLSTLEREITLPHFEPFSQDKPATELTVEFIQRVRDLAGAIQNSRQYKLPILCFLDEVERILPMPEDRREKAEEFNACFGALRVLCQERRQMSLLIADVHPDCNRMNSWSQKGVGTNPVFSFFKEVFLPPFSEEETQEMLINIGKLMGLEFDELFYKQIHHQSGGHPFVSRQLARFLTDKTQAQGIKSSTDGNKVSNENKLIEYSKVEQSLEKLFKRNSELKNYLEKSIWEDLEKRDFQVAIAVLRTLACNEQFRERITEQALLNQLRGRFIANQCLDACYWLISVGLLDHEKVNDQDTYRIQVPLLSRWIQMQMTDEEIEQCQIL